MAGVMEEWEKRGREREGNFQRINRERQKKKNHKANNIQEICVIRKAAQWEKSHKTGTFLGFRTLLKAVNNVNVLQ